MAQVQEAQAPAGQAQKLVEELKVSAHLMTLETGVFCLFHAPGSQVVDVATGLPAVRVTLPPDMPDEPRDVSIRTFRDDGWIGVNDAAALIRVPTGPAQVLITIYQRAGAAEPAPKIQIQQLSDGSTPAAQPAGAQPLPPNVSAADAAAAEVAAHIQRRGDVIARIGEWMGERGSQRWIEGFAIAPQGDAANGEVTRSDIEYQAVLGRGWLSPWSEGGQYCGSRGMALPVLGLRVRLKGDRASSHQVRLSATFTDGTAVGPVDHSKTCEAESLAPLEAFQVELIAIGDAKESASAAIAGTVAKSGLKSAKRK